jgi:hypothetical protein
MVAAPSGAKLFPARAQGRRHDVLPIRTCDEPAATSGCAAEPTRECVTIASIVLRVRLLNGDRLDVTYDLAAAADATHALEASPLSRPNREALSCRDSRSLRR